MSIFFRSRKNIDKSKMLDFKEINKHEKNGEKPLCKFDLSEEGFPIVDIHLKNLDDIYDEWSYDEDLGNSQDGEVKDLLVDYIHKRASHISRGGEKVAVRFIVEEPYEKEEAAEAERELKEHAALKMHSLKIQKKVQTFWGWGFVLFAFIAVAISVLLLSLNVDDNFVFETIMGVACWFFLWEAGDMLLINRPPIRLRYMAAAKIYFAPVMFVQKNDFTAKK